MNSQNNSLIVELAIATGDSAYDVMHRTLEAIAKWDPTLTETQQQLARSALEFVAAIEANPRWRTRRGMCAKCEEIRAIAIGRYLCEDCKASALCAKMTSSDTTGTHA